MWRTSRKRYFALAGALTLSSYVGFSYADASSASETERCLAGSEQGQLARQAAGYRKAREQFAICARAECPRAVSRDCVRWLDELDRIQPTVILAARDANGRDLSAVEVRIDDELVSKRIVGRAIDVDPGEHVVRFKAADGREVIERVVLRDNEKNRLLMANFSRLRPARPRPRGAALPRSDGDHESGLPVISWVLGVAGVVAGGVGTYFLVTGKERENELSSSCAPRCPHDEVDAVRARYLGGGIAVGAGVALLGAAVVIAFVAPSRKERAERPLVWRF